MGIESLLLVLISQSILYLSQLKAVDLMKKMLTKDPTQRISSQEALDHEWTVTGGMFMSPQTNTPVYLLPAQENMRKVIQEQYSHLIFFS